MKAITIAGVKKAFRQKRVEVHALKGISLEVGEGEVFGFVGPNGAGKSTTIKILLNIINAYEGLVSIFGHDARKATSRFRVGYVPESASLYEQLTPLDILRASMAMHGIQHDHPDAHCKKWLERFSIAGLASRRIGQLSKGTVQRVALANAMVLSPRLLVLDEPLSGLDPVGRKDVVDILAEYKGEGGTVFLTSHVLHDVERLADRFGLIHQGELRTIQSPNELVGEADLVTVRSAGLSPVVGMREESTGRWVGECERGGLWGLLRLLEAGGHTIIELKPQMTLESAFMRYLGK